MRRRPCSRSGVTTERVVNAERSTTRIGSCILVANLWRNNVMNRKLLGVVVVSLLLAGCATGTHFGVPDRAMRVPQWVLDAEAAMARAEASAGARVCPDKIAKAKELAAKAMETYWACRDLAAQRLMHEALQLAADAEACSAPSATEPATSNCRLTPCSPSTRRRSHRKVKRPSISSCKTWGVPRSVRFKLSVTLTRSAPMHTTCNSPNSAPMLSRSIWQAGACRAIASAPKAAARLSSKSRPRTAPPKARRLVRHSSNAISRTGVSM